MNDYGYFLSDDMWTDRDIFDKFLGLFNLKLLDEYCPNFEVGADYEDTLYYSFHEVCLDIKQHTISQEPYGYLKRLFGNE